MANFANLLLKSARSQFKNCSDIKAKFHHLSDYKLLFHKPLIKPQLLIQKNENSLNWFRPFDRLQCPENIQFLRPTSFGKNVQKSPSPSIRFLQKRFIVSQKEKPRKGKRAVPKLILLQNPLKWLRIKFDFFVLKHFWDSSFAEKEFMFGTKQAVSRVTQLISAGELLELNGLLTKPARMSLIRELDRRWTKKQRSVLALDRDDIQITSPRNVHFIKIAGKKYCDVDMAFLGLKWMPINYIDTLILTEIFAKFHREYTPHSIPEWTIAYFKVTRLQILRRKVDMQ